MTGLFGAKPVEATVSVTNRAVNSGGQWEQRQYVAASKQALNGARWGEDSTRQARPSVLSGPGAWFKGGGKQIGSIPAS